MSAESLSENDPGSFLFFRNNAKIYYITYNKILKYEKLVGKTDLIIYVYYIIEGEIFRILTIKILYGYINNGKRRENKSLRIIYWGERFKTNNKKNL